MSSLRPIRGWREEWALAALNVMAHDPAGVSDAALELARDAQSCSSPRVCSAAATFLTVHDPTSDVNTRVAVLAAHVTTARDRAVAADERLRALDVSPTAATTGLSCIVESCLFPVHSAGPLRSSHTRKEPEPLHR